MSQPPVAPQHHTIHRQHGVERPDDYHWLRDKTSEESLSYLRAERAYYDEQMKPLTELVDELTQEMIGRGSLDRRFGEVARGLVRVLHPSSRRA